MGGGDVLSLEPERSGGQGSIEGLLQGASKLQNHPNLRSYPSTAGHFLSETAAVSLFQYDKYSCYVM